MFSIVVTLVALSISVLLTAFMIHYGGRRGWVVMPRKDRWSSRVVAQFGGIPILLAFVVATLCFAESRFAFSIVALTLAMGVLGLIDDLRGLTPLMKLLVQAGIAAAAIAAGAIVPLTAHYAINVAFSLVWIVGITNAVNLMDNMDGLAAGVSVVSLVTMLFLFHGNGSLTLALLAMSGALLGFLAFNFHPAKIFMGDVGSLAIGFFLAVASTHLSQYTFARSAAVFVPLLILFTPVFDTTLVSVTRRLSGRAISHGSKDHLSHRMVFLGLSERQSVLMIYGIAATAGLLAYFLQRPYRGLSVLALAVFFVVAVCFWTYLATVRLPKDWLSAVRARNVRAAAKLIITARSIFSDLAISTLGFLFAFTLSPVHLGGRFGSRAFIVSLAGAVLFVTFLAIFGAYRRDWKPSRIWDLLPVVIGFVAAAVVFVAMALATQTISQLTSLLAGLISSFAFVVFGRLSHHLLDMVFLRVPLNRNAPIYALADHGQQDSAVALAANQDREQRTNQIPVVSLEHHQLVCEHNRVRRVELLPRCPHDEAGKFAEFCSQKGIPLVSEPTINQISTGAY
jgi:UDP-GlcNAc:undecaprenyl-phosphate GlcNAc-1-phosphate transferase